MDRRPELPPHVVDRNRLAVAVAPARLVRNPESTPLIVAAIAVSTAVVGAVWFYWRRPAVLWAAGAVMAAFAVLDMIEVAHQVAKAHTTLVVLAGTVAALHLAAAVLAIRVLTTRSAAKTAVVS
jgi:hypothetical protein